MEEANRENLRERKRHANEGDSGAAKKENDDILPPKLSSGDTSSSSGTQHVQRTKDDDTNGRDVGGRQEKDTRSKQPGLSRISSGDSASSNTSSASHTIPASSVNSANTSAAPSPHAAITAAVELDAPNAQKIQEILSACRRQDLPILRRLATTSGGLISDEVRRIAWPILLGYTHRNEDDNIVERCRSLPEHQMEEQVKLDVNRSFCYYPRNLNDNQLNRLKEQLETVIVALLRTHPYLSYSQGYHDICQVFLLVFDTNPIPSIPPLIHLSLLRTRDLILPNLEHFWIQLRLLPDIIRAANPAIYNHIRTHTADDDYYFATGATLTMYAHEIQDYTDIARIFDVLLAREAVFSIYMFAAITLSRSDEIFAITEYDPSMPMLQSLLQRLPRPFDVETCIQDTVQLIAQHPPETLSSWRWISKNSVLKTARWPDEMAKQTLEEGKAWYMKQVIEAMRTAKNKENWEHFKRRISWNKWEERLQRHRKIFKRHRGPIIGIGMAVMVGVISLCLRNKSISERLAAVWEQYLG